MKRKKRYSTIIYKGETVGFFQEYYYCLDSKSIFTTTELDALNLNRVIAAYEKTINQ